MSILLKFELLEVFFNFEKGKNASCNLGDRIELTFCVLNLLLIILLKIAVNDGRERLRLGSLVANLGAARSIHATGYFSFCLCSFIYKNCTSVLLCVFYGEYVLLLCCRICL